MALLLEDKINSPKIMAVLNEIRSLGAHQAIDTFADVAVMPLLAISKNYIKALPELE